MPPTTTESTPRQQDRLYHDLFTPEEAQAVRTEVRAFANAHVAPQAHAIAVREESVESFPRELFRKMGRAGLFAIPFGRENGGRGLKHRATATAVAIEELAYHSNSVAAIYDVHCILAGHALEYASPALRDRYLLPVTRGEVVGAFATSEPDASTDLSLQALGTHARLEGDTWVVNGRKRFITNSPVADFVVALCRTGDGMSMLLVDLRAPGVRVGTPDARWATRASSPPTSGSTRFACRPATWWGTRARGCASRWPPSPMGASGSPPRAWEWRRPCSTRACAT